MEVIIEKLGTKVCKESGTFVIETKENKITKVSPMQAETIVIYPGVSITTNALLLAMEKKCDIIFVDSFGQPKGRLWNNEFNSTANLRRRQYEVFSTEAGTEIAKEYIIEKLNGFLKILEELKIKDNTAQKNILEALEKIKTTTGKPDKIRGTIMGHEGSAGRLFYKNISNILPTKYQFENRELQHATNEFNRILNYYYGVLYRICEGELIKKGFDPFIGILHSDSYNKKSFLFDFIECFRPWAILRATKFIKNKHIRAEHFDENGLTKEGKKAIMLFLNDFLDKKEKFDNKMYIRRNIIGKKVEELSKKLRGDDDEIFSEL